MKLLSGRKRRIRKIRSKIREQGKIRLTVNRTPRHIYAQVFTSDGSQVLVTASSLDKEIKDAGLKGKKQVAFRVGNLVAEKALAKGIKQVAFDRSGFKFHGRIEELANGAKDKGLEF